MSDTPHRDVEKVYSTKDFVAKLRRLADALEQGKPFTIQVQNERITVPAGAEISIEHERDDEGEELEFQLTWRRAAKSEGEGSEEEEEGEEEEDADEAEEAGEATETQSNAEEAQSPTTPQD